MKAEIICIGTELLLGDIVNTNASYLARELAETGIDLYYISTVGDNISRIVDTFEIASRRADLIITSGGLGPTADDLSHEAIAKFLGVEMVYNQDIAEALTDLFKSRGRYFSKTNLKQAYFPAGADILPNPHGTAPGIIYQKEQKIIISFPGVPSELKNMWQNTARPFLSSLFPDKSLLKSRTLHFTGEGESTLAEKVSDLLDLKNPTVAPYAGKGEVRLRITAKAKNEREAESLIEPVEKEILNRIGKYCYGKDNDTLNSVVARLLTENNSSIAVAESFTGGLLAERIVSVPGASNYFGLGLVCYSTDMKIKMLGVDKETIDKYTVYSEEVALEMAEKVRKLAGTEWGIGTTGIAGPASGNDTDDKIGTIYVAVSSEKKTKVKMLNYKGWQRENIIYMGSQAALNLLRLMLINP